MKLEFVKIDRAINRTYFKQSLNYADINLFKTNFKQLFAKVDTNEGEEHNKNIVSNFLRDTFYKEKYEITTAGQKDLVIHSGKANKTPVAVIIESKKPSLKLEMISRENPNSKALHQTIHYYLRERIFSQNTDIKHVIISNIYDWFIFDANEFQKRFYQNKPFRSQYEAWNNGQLAGKTTDWFYTEIAKPYVEKIDSLACTYINLRDYSEIAAGNDKQDDKRLINLYKLFSPEHLLKLPFANDYNKIDDDFYNELLYIFGLQEVTNAAGLRIITREQNRKSGTILEDTINSLTVQKKIDKIEHPELFGKSDGERLFSIALELSITWLNRILFLKLLESQLVSYHKDNSDYAFISSEKIKYFEELDELFFEVLAVKPENRTQSVNKRFGNLPYLNSSLFEQTELEKQTLQISDLKNRLTIPLQKGSVLKQKPENQQLKELNTLKYLLDFLSAYNFSSETKAEIQNDKRTIINAAVLGLIFEKINGYKDGSYYTPSFITTYISRETLKKTVVDKFNERSKLTGFSELLDFEELKERIDYADKKERQVALYKDVKDQRAKEQILAKKEADKQADISAEQAKIDNFVYELYELTDDEILLLKKTRIQN